MLGVGCHSLLQEIFLTQGSKLVSPALLAGGFFTSSATEDYEEVHIDMNCQQTTLSHQAREMGHGPSALQSTEWLWTGSSQVLVSVPPLVSPAILPRSLLCACTSLLPACIMGGESFLRTLRALHCELQVYLEGRRGEEPPERFPSRPPGSRIDLRSRGCERGQGHSCLGRRAWPGGHPESVL